MSTLVVKNITYSEKIQKAEILTDQNAKVSSDKTHCGEFQRRKIDQEIYINRVFVEKAGLDNDQSYNTLFSIKELKSIER